MHAHSQVVDKYGQAEEGAMALGVPYVSHGKILSKINWDRFILFVMFIVVPKVTFFRAGKRGNACHVETTVSIAAISECLSSIHLAIYMDVKVDITRIQIICKFISNTLL